MTPLSMRAGSIPPALVQRLAVPGPRYTSYPPANVWGDLGPESYAGALGALASADVGVYVHVPYCKVRCGYCGLNVSGSRSAESRLAGSMPWRSW